MHDEIADVPEPVMSIDKPQGAWRSYTMKRERCVCCMIGRESIRSRDSRFAIVQRIHLPQEVLGPGSQQDRLFVRSSRSGMPIYSTVLSAMGFSGGSLGRPLQAALSSV